MQSEDYKNIAIAEIKAMLVAEKDLNPPFDYDCYLLRSPAGYSELDHKLKLAGYDRKSPIRKKEDPDVALSIKLTDKIIKIIEREYFDKVKEHFRAVISANTILTFPIISVSISK